MQLTIGHLIDYAVANYPDDISLINFTALVRRARVRNRQVNIDGQVTIAKYGQLIAEVPALVAANLQRPHDERDLLVLMHIPRAVADEAHAVLTSPLISPNGTTIIQPP